MASLRDIRRRIRSVKNTAQITRAMEMVAASRMRRAQQRVIAARPYADSIQRLLSELAAVARTAGQAPHPLLVQRPVDSVGIILMTSDRGLAGALNTNVIRRGTQLLMETTDQRRVEASLITVGRKGQDFMARRGQRMLYTFTQLGDTPTSLDIGPIAAGVIDSYTNAGVDEWWIVYQQFVSTLTQRPTVVQILPITPGASETRPREYIFEPDPVAILEELLPRYVEMTIYRALLESIASEHSARMIAMRNATENAKELVQSLTLSYNKARQAAITGEVTEIAAAAEALSGAT